MLGTLLLDGPVGRPLNAASLVVGGQHAYNLTVFFFEGFGLT